MNGPKKLKKLLKHNECKILLPSIVVDEFHRNVNAAVSNAKRRASNLLSEANRIASFCHKGIDVHQLIDNIGKSIDEVLEEIEALFSISELLSIEYQALLDSLQYSIGQKRPFHGKQLDSLADATILFSLLDYAKRNDLKYDEIMIVSSNYKDFAESVNKKEELHNDIRILFDGFRVSLRANIESAIHKISPRTTSLATLKKLQVSVPVLGYIEDDSLVRLSWDMYTCPVCGSDLSDHNLRFVSGLHGHSGWLTRCTSCQGEILFVDSSYC
jgi:DNA repair exonuclease SbcCD ATPase subunit